MNGGPNSHILTLRYPTDGNQLRPETIFFQQVGWAQRESDRQLVIFDLEPMAQAPRFTDIANILKSLAHSTGRDLAELFMFNLACYCELTGRDVRLNLALH